MEAVKSELDQFLQVWDMEAKSTTRLLEALPTDKYDFRPDAGGRSLGELAWHLAELDAYTAYGLEQNKFDIQGQKPPGIERPREVKALAPGYRKVHEDAVARVRKLKAEDMQRTMKFFGDKDMKVSEILWGGLLFHQVHHRGQLALMCRLAGGKAPGMYGPNREESAEMQAAMKAGSNR